MLKLYLLDKAACATAIGTDVADVETLIDVLGVVRLILNVICIVVPIILIVLGTIDLFKAVTAGKEEDIKKRQKVLITRLIAGVLIFLIPTIVTLIMNLIGINGWSDCWNEATAGVGDLFKTY